MGATRQAVSPLWWLAEDAQADTAHEPNVNDLSVAETRRAEVDVDPRREDQVPSRPLIREEREHEVLQESAGRGYRHVDPACGVAGLLEEDSVTGELADVDGDVQALAGEDSVHDRDVLVCGVGAAADGDDEDAGLEAGGVECV